MLASVLLAAISFMLVPAALFASTDSDVPACCRKDGKHKCAMSEMGDDNAGPAMRSSTQCPMFPSHTTAAQACSVVGAPVPLHHSEIHITSFLKSAQQAEAQYRLSFSRTRQKRGPPSQFSSSI